MGVVNTTPDSFSDGGSLYAGKHLDLARVLDRAREMEREGASILDIGGESTRPGAAVVGLQQEVDRVVPCVEAIRAQSDILISVDTSSPQVMRAAAAAGATMINDVRALTRDGALQVAAELQLPVCLMHMQGQPEDMQAQPRYRNVVQEVADFLAQRIELCLQAGISSQLIFLDPGFGFGKSVSHNLQLLQGLPQLAGLGYPLLVGLSRKSMIGKLLGRKVDERLPASLALAVLAVERGASVIRTHDVAATVDAVAMVSALDTIGAGESE
jgi:dihydropteroate synthase